MAAVMLIVFVSIAVLLTTVFIVERLRQEASGNQLSAKCIYLAQAGVFQACYFFRFRDLTGNGYFSLGSTTVNAGEAFTLSATAADLLMVDTSGASLGSGNKDLEELKIQNATNSNSITIDRMIVSWNNSRRLQKIEIDGERVWNGNSLSPANANIDNFTLDTTPTDYDIDYLRFSGSMSGTTISIQFVMTDGSTKDALVAYPASNNYNFRVKSTGQVSGWSVYRLIQADYNALTGKIIGYRES